MAWRHPALAATGVGREVSRDEVASYPHRQAGVRCHREPDRLAPACATGGQLASGSHRHCHESGPYYGFWSGFGSDLEEFGACTMRTWTATCTPPACPLVMPRRPGTVRANKVRVWAGPPSAPAGRAAEDHPKRLASHDADAYGACGAPISIIGKWAGHYDSAFTQKTYVHASEEDLQRGQAALARIHRSGTSSTIHERRFDLLGQVDAR